MKFVSPEEAVRCIKSHDRVFIHSVAAQIDEGVGGDQHLVASAVHATAYDVESHRA